MFVGAEFCMSTVTTMLTTAADKAARQHGSKTSELMSTITTELTTAGDKEQGEGERERGGGGGGSLGGLNAAVHSNAAIYNRATIPSG